MKILKQAEYDPYYPHSPHPEEGDLDCEELALYEEELALYKMPENLEELENQVFQDFLADLDDVLHERYKIHQSVVEPNKNEYIVEYQHSPPMYIGGEGHMVERDITLNFIPVKQEYVGGRWDGLQLHGEVDLDVNQLIEVFDSTPNVSFNFCREDAKKKSYSDICLIFDGLYTSREFTASYFLRVYLIQRKQKEV